MEKVRDNLLMGLITLGTLGAGLLHFSLASTCTVALEAGSRKRARLKIAWRVSMHLLPDLQTNTYTKLSL